MGEWIVCVSSRASRKRSTSIDEAEAFIQMPAECCQQLASMDGDTGRKAEPMDTANVPKAFVTTSNDSENLGSSDILRMYLGSARPHPGDANRVGLQVDGSHSQADVLRDQTDAPIVSDNTETASISHGKGAGMYLGVGGMKWPVEVMDSIGSHADASSGHSDMPSIGVNVDTPANEAKTVSRHLIEPKPPEPPTKGANSCGNKSDRLRNHTDALSGHWDVPSIKADREMTANATKIIRASQNSPKMQNSPIGTAKWTSDEPNRCGNPTDTLSICMDTHCVRNGMEMAADKAENIRTRQIKLKMQNLPAGAERRCAGIADDFGSHMDVLTM